MKRFIRVLLMMILTSVLLASCSKFAPPDEISAQSQTPVTSPSQRDSRVDLTPEASTSLSPPEISEQPSPAPPDEISAQSQTPATSPSQSDSQVNLTPEKSTSPSPPEISEQPSPSTEPVTYPDTADLTFSDLSGMGFFFASGVGAWCTEIVIMSDGSFSGYHSDQDMGDTGPDYPEGTRYFCSFTGKFSSLTKTGDYEYSMKCVSLTQDGMAGEVEIDDDGWRYITSHPYGFDDADVFMLYLPGKKIDELPEAFLSWVSMPLDISFEDADVLDFYGLYNVEGEQGFSH